MNGSSSPDLWVEQQLPINQMINQLPSFQQALQALRVRKKKQPAPMRVLAAACRFLGRLLFSYFYFEFKA